jgi:hypothetical protein
MCHTVTDNIILQFTAQNILWNPAELFAEKEISSVGCHRVNLSCVSVASRTRPHLDLTTSQLRSFRTCDTVKLIFTQNCRTYHSKTEFRTYTILQCSGVWNPNSLTIHSRELTCLVLAYFPYFQKIKESCLSVLFSVYPPNFY